MRYGCALFSLVRNLSAVDEHAPPYSLSVCTVMTSDAYLDARFNRSVSDVALRVAEWVEFHLMVGFEHFFVFDNSAVACSRLYEVLLPYMAAGRVTYVHWPAPLCATFFEGLSAWRRWGAQIAALNACLGRFGSMTRWMALHDVDEFMAPALRHFDTVPALLKAIDGLAQLNSIGFVQKLLLNCTHLKYGAHADYEHSDRMASIFSRHQCAFRTLEPKNKKLLIRPLRMRAILIHFPTFFYPGFALKELVLNASEQAVMYHARSSRLFGKNDYYVLPPDHNMLACFDRLHARLARQRLAAAVGWTYNQSDMLDFFT